MPAISGETLVPNGPRTGAAYVLPNTNQDALSIILQGDRNRALARQRAEAVQQKAREDDLRRFTTLLSSVKDDTGLTYQQQHMAEREQVGQEFMNTALDKNISPQQKQLALDNIKTRYEQRGLLGKQIDDSIKAAADKARPDKELDWEKVTKRLHGLQYGEDGKVLAVDQFPLRKMDDVLEDPSLYNTGAIYDNFVNTKVAPREIYQQAAGGKPGTFARSYTDEIRFYKRNADGSLWRDPKTHKPQVEVTPELLEKAMEHPRIKRDLEGMMSNHQALTTSATQKMANYEALTPEERGALDVDPTMADLLGRRLSSYGYANHRENQRYVKVPQPKASSGSGQDASFDERTVAPAEVGATVPQQTEFTKFFNVPQLAPTHNFHSERHAGAPLIPQKNGTRKPVTVPSFYSREAYEEDGNGQLRHVTNNTKQSDVTLGDAYQLPVDPATNRAVFPKNKEEEQELYRKGYQKQTFVAGYVDKNENFNADYDRRLKELVAQNNQEYDPSRKKTPSQLEDEARKAASKGVARRLYPYNKDTFGTIDNATKYYKQFHQGTVKARQQVAAPKADPLGFGTSEQAPKPRAQADPLGFGDTGGPYTRPKRPSFIPTKPKTTPGTGGMY